MNRKRPKREDPYGVDAPLTRMLLTLIYLHTGALPEGFDETWLDKLPIRPKPEPPKRN